MAHHVVSMAAHALIYSPEGQLLTIKRDGNPYLRGYWSVPAGHIDAGETAALACVREVREEVGIHLAIPDLQFVLVQQKSASDGEERVDFFFAATCSRPENAHRASKREVAALQWSDPGDLPQPFAPYVEHALNRIREAVLLSYWDM
jgi:8-oxo-dGTP diphosphatase